MRRRFGHKSGNRKKAFTVLMILVIMLIYFYYLLEKNIKPTLLAMSEIDARLIATQAINEAVSKRISSNSFNNLIDFRTDNNGKISIIQANTVQMTRLAAETTMEVQNKIREIGSSNIKIPISNIIGSQVFANVGPKINVNIKPAGTVTVDYYTDFKEAGINQTRLKIYLVVKTDVQVIVPLVNNKVDVTTQIPVSETIIVGDVPKWENA